MVLALKNMGWKLSRISNTVKILCTIPCISDMKCVIPTLYRKFETHIPRNETVRPGSNFTIHLLYLLAIYICTPTIGVIWNLYFPVLRERTLYSTAGAESTRT